MRLGFFGAAGEVTGSCTLVEAGDTRFLVDCGMVRMRGQRSHGHTVGKVTVRQRLAFARIRLVAVRFYWQR